MLWRIPIRKPRIPGSHNKAVLLTWFHAAFPSRSPSGYKSSSPFTVTVSFRILTGFSFAHPTGCNLIAITFVHINSTWIFIFYHIIIKMSSFLSYYSRIYVKIFPLLLVCFQKFIYNKHTYSPYMFLIYNALFLHKSEKPLPHIISVCKEKASQSFIC